MPRSTYAIALGANRRGRHGSPEQTVAAVIAQLDGLASPIVRSAPVGPSTRAFANAVVLVGSDLAPPAMLAWLKAMERALGRRRGRRWGARVIDLDIVLWSGGSWRDRRLTIPHAAFRGRDFVLDPLVAIAPSWRDPGTKLTVRQLRARLTRPRPLPTSGRAGRGP